MATKKPQELPSKLSDLLDLAVTDALALDKRRRRGKRMFKLNMQKWVEPIDGVCHVCMAGSVMVRRLGASTKDRSLPSRIRVCRPIFDRYQIACRLTAINDMREGRFEGAAASVDAPPLPQPLLKRLLAATARGFHTQVWETSWRLPWRTYRRCARILREAGY